MTQSDSLFGHLALRFGPHPENLATEALTYLLQSTPTARRALVQAARTTGADIPDELSFRSQVVGEDQAVPDIVGVDAEGTERLMIEAKFWAGLTERQPVHYLGRLKGKRALLLFVAPAQRLESLWPELERRTIGANLPILAMTSPPSAIRAGRVDSTRVLAAMSWRSVLDAISVELSVTSEVRVRENVEQLRGLCDRMDADAFLPLRSEELTMVTPARLLQFYGVIDDLATRSLTTWCNAKGLRSGNSYHAYGRYLRLNRSTVGLFLHTHLRKWAIQRATPFWLRITGPGTDGPNMCARFWRNWRTKRLRDCWMTSTIPEHRQRAALPVPRSRARRGDAEPV
jgi:hypothetical protein